VNCIQSILDQTYQEFEIIIADNASSDETLVLIKGFNDARIKVYRNFSNIGPHGNFNLAISKAEAPLIKTFCSDDVMNAFLLETQVRLFSIYPRLGVASCNAMTIEESGQRWVWRVQQGYETGRGVLNRCLDCLSNSVGNPSSFMFRREAIVGLGFDARLQYLSDVNLPAKILDRNWDYFGLDMVGFDYVRHPAVDSNETFKYELQNWVQLLSDFHIAHPDAIHSILSRGSSRELEDMVLQHIEAVGVEKFKCYKVLTFLNKIKDGQVKKRLAKLYVEKFNVTKRIKASVLRSLVYAKSLFVAKT
jgi:glycosyltransferase involved in cell wall biosynthesis